MPPILLTDWVTIGTSGATVDGRKISADDLKAMAETYDPMVYTAVLNVEHYYGNLGTVRELRTAPGVRGETALQARIAPNKYLLQQNAESMRLFTSMEITRNFAGTDKPYLTGLATTDTPASLGTTELHFSKGSPLERADAVELDLHSLFDASGKKPGGVFDEFFNRLGEFFVGKYNAKEHDMTKDELLSAITEAVKPLIEKLTALTAQVDKFKPAETAAPAAPPAAPATAAPAAPAAPAATDFAAALNPITEQLTALSGKLDALTAETPSTKLNKGTGPTGGEKFI